MGKLGRGDACVPGVDDTRFTDDCSLHSVDLKLGMSEEEMCSNLMMEGIDAPRLLHQTTRGSERLALILQQTAK